MPDLNDFVANVQNGVRGFADDMREQGIHVGVNHRCVTCGEAWPCAGSVEPTGEED